MVTRADTFSAGIWVERHSGISSEIEMIVPVRCQLYPVRYVSSEIVREAYPPIFQSSLVRVTGTGWKS